MNEVVYMIDIETTGVNKETDDILEIGIVPISFIEGFWKISGDYFHRIIHSKRSPENKFAIDHMSELYKKCNNQSESQSYQRTATELQYYLHPELDDLDKHASPKLFMGWNASNFDLEFMFKKELLTPSYYYMKGDKEVLGGDVHYRVYEQTGALQLVCDVTGLNRKLAQDLSDQMIPQKHRLELPQGKQHDAIYDCYSQINMMNGMISLMRSGFKISGNQG